VDLHIEAGEHVLLLGPSGAGKSTLLLALAGLLEPVGGAESEGTLAVRGLPAREARTQTGIVFQDPTTQLVMPTAGDDVAFGLENRGVPTDAIWKRVQATLDAVGFAYRLDRRTDALSGGEQQRLAIAGVLALGPRLLLLDEPTASLDPQGAEMVRAVLGDILARTDTTAIVVEHHIDELLPMITRVIVLEPGGGIVADGTPLEVFELHGDDLATAGVWVPGRRVEPPPAHTRPPSQTLVLAEQAGFTYPGAKVPSLARVDAQLRSSEALGIVGPNGSGKSTLAWLLAGLIRPGAGEVVAGEAIDPGHGHEPIWRWPARTLARRMGVVFQDPGNQFLAGTVFDELALGPRRIGVGEEEARRRATELLDRLRLGHLAEANPFTLSGGEQRRLSVATALATAPAAIVLDEPTFGQDRSTWTELLALLAALRDSGRAICFATHDREFASALADRQLRLGPPRAQGTQGVPAA